MYIYILSWRKGMEATNAFTHWPLSPHRPIRDHQVWENSYRGLFNTQSFSEMSLLPRESALLWPLRPWNRAEGPIRPPNAQQDCVYTGCFGESQMAHGGLSDRDSFEKHGDSDRPVAWELWVVEFCQTVSWLSLSENIIGDSTRLLLLLLLLHHLWYIIYDI